MKSLLKNGEGYVKLHKYYQDKFDLLNGKTNFKEEDFVIPKNLMENISNKLFKATYELIDSFANYFYSPVFMVTPAILLYKVEELEDCLYNIKLSYLANGPFYEEIYDYISCQMYQLICSLNEKCSDDSLSCVEEKLKDMKYNYSPKELPFTISGTLYNFCESIDLYNKTKRIIQTYCNTCLDIKEYHEIGDGLDYLTHTNELILMELYEDIKKYVSNLGHNDTAKSEVRKLLFLLKVKLFEKN